MNAFNEIGLDKVKFFGMKKERKPINFIGHRYIFFAVSLAVIIAGFVAMGYYGKTSGRALNYSLDFVGGTQTTVDFGKDYSMKQLDTEIVPKIEKVTGDANVQVQKVQDGTSVIFKTRTLTVEERKSLDSMFEKDYSLKDTAITAETISSTISNEMRADAVWAVIITSLCIMLYVWIRFKDLRIGASAIIALVHDVLVTLTLYAIVRVSVGSTFIACMLTLVGYSINDTIVVFDRIRENVRPYGKNIKDDDLKFVINDSITQTLSRSLFTSFTTVVMVASLYVFGVSSIREFALPLMVGIISGTYSSVCIASPLWFMLKKVAIKKENGKGKKGKNKKEIKTVEAAKADQTDKAKA
jgi:SecD/SecF fusion protein